jgi:hypothetical protein
VIFLRVVGAVASVIVLSSCGAESTESADSTDSTATATASPSTPSESSATPIAEEAPLEPFCEDLTAAIAAVPPLDPTGKQIFAVKSSIEEARPSLTGKVAREVEGWYGQTVDLAGAQFNRVNDEAAYTKAWAEWTMGARVGIQSQCSA